MKFTSDNFDNMIGFQNTIEFDQDKLQLLGFELNNIDFNFMGASNLDFAAEGIVNVVWAAGNGEPISHDINAELFTMTFTAKEDVQIRDVITFNSTSTLDIAYNEDEESMEVIK